MKDWHRIQKTGALEIEDKKPTILINLINNDADVLWQTSHRTFTINELKTRQVPRKTGIAILSAVKEARTALAASTLANVLRGTRSSSYVSKHPELSALTQFGMEKGRNYNDVLMDVLAMWAKGYLQLASDQNKRLVLSQKGQNTPGRTSPKSAINTQIWK
jgi:hypothetical protein